MNDILVLSERQNQSFDEPRSTIAELFNLITNYFLVTEGGQI